jgi:DNA repair exonuclease SbcCD ATPase subunit
MASSCTLCKGILDQSFDRIEELKNRLGQAMELNAKADRRIEELEGDLTLMTSHQAAFDERAARMHAEHVTMTLNHNAWAKRAIEAEAKVKKLEAAVQYACVAVMNKS